MDTITITKSEYDNLIRNMRTMAAALSKEGKDAERQMGAYRAAVDVIDDFIHNHGRTA